MISRSMLSLPAVAQGSACWQLPLCDATALALANAAVESNAHRRAEQLAVILASDPALAVWSVSRWALNSKVGSSDRAAAGAALSISILADWLSPRLEKLLDWDDNEHLIKVTEEQYGRYAALVAESVGAAYEALHLSGGGLASGQPAYLAALTARWNEWFDISGSGEGGPASGRITWPLPTSSLPQTNSTEARAAADAAWRQWLSENPVARNLLPSLARQIRRLADSEATFDRRLHEAKLDALKEFAYGAGHELNNPLANIASRAQTLLTEETHPERRRRLAAINTQAFRAHEMLADLMLFARPPKLVPQKIDLTFVVDELLTELADEAAAQQTKLHAPTRRDPLWIEADLVQLRVALRALCVNALEAVGRDGNVTVELHVCSAVGENCGEQVQIIISDDGPGIASEIRDKIFDPFFSGREAGRGLGFGLSKCWRIVTLHGGRIEASQPPGSGAVFTIFLPVQAGGVSTAAAVDEGPKT